MEEKRGILPHMSGLIRLIIIILVLVVLTFLLVRWARNRQAIRKARQVTESSQQKVTENSKQKTSEERQDQANDNKAADSSKSSTSTDSHNSSDSSVATVPSGIANSNAAPETQTVPQTGLGDSILLMSLSLASIIFLIVKNLAYQQQIRSNLR